MKVIFSQSVLVLSFLLPAGIVTVLPSFAQSTHAQPTQPPAAVQAAQAKRADSGQSKPMDPSKVVFQPKPTKQSTSTAAVVNQVPGVKVNASDLEPPESPPIKGFHPIKRLVQPIVRLEGASIKLEQQMMKMEGPIAALHPPMVGLEEKMGDVHETMGKMQDQVNGVDGQMKGVRSDLAKMHTEIVKLKAPMMAVQKPLVGVGLPLERVQRQLDYVLAAIIIATIGIVFGTPIAAVLIYRHKDKLFPAKVAQALPEDKQMATSGISDKP